MDNAKYEDKVEEGKKRERVFEDVLLHAQVRGRGIATEEFMTKPPSSEPRWLRFEQPRGGEGYYFVDVSRDICFLLPVDHVTKMAADFASAKVIPSGNVRGRAWLAGEGGISIPTVRAFEGASVEPGPAPAKDGPCRRPVVSEDKWKYDFELAAGHCDEGSVGQFILWRPSHQGTVRFEHKSSLRSADYEHHAFIERELRRIDGQWGPSGVDHTEAELFAIEWREKLWAIFRTECLRSLCDVIQETKQGGKLIPGAKDNDGRETRGVKLSLPDVLDGLHLTMR